MLIEECIREKTDAVCLQRSRKFKVFSEKAVENKTVYAGVL
jgi:hypothetical protein